MSAEEISAICEAQASHVECEVMKYIIRNPKAEQYKDDMIQECMLAIVQKASNLDSIDDFFFGELDVLHVCAKHFRQVLGVPAYIRVTTDLVKAREMIPLNGCEKAPATRVDIENLDTALEFDSFFVSLDPISRWVLKQKLDGINQKTIAADMKVSAVRVNEIMKKIKRKYLQFKTGDLASASSGGAA